MEISSERCSEVLAEGVADALTWRKEGALMTQKRFFKL